MADEADSADGAARWTRWRDGRGYGFPAAAPPVLPRGRPDRLHPTAAGSQGGRAGVRGGCRSPDTHHRMRDEHHRGHGGGRTRRHVWLLDESENKLHQRMEKLYLSTRAAKV